MTPLEKQKQFKVELSTLLSKYKAETILKEKLINIKIDNPDLTFNKVIEAMQEHTQQHLKALAEDIKENGKVEYSHTEPYTDQDIYEIDKESIDQITNKHIDNLK